MSKYGNLAAGLSGVVVMGNYEVFVLNERSAKICAEKYHGELQKLDDGWLAKKKIEPAATDDPLTQAIMKDLAEAGLTQS